MTAVRIALANLIRATTPDDSIARASRAIEEAAFREAAIVCFPECYIPGYRTPDRTVPPPDAVFLQRAWATIA